MKYDRGPLRQSEIEYLEKSKENNKNNHITNCIKCRECGKPLYNERQLLLKNCGCRLMSEMSHER